jgi:hypothetical protein
MPIQFPKMHIAQSAINRIINAMNDAPSFGLTPPSEPIVPDPVIQGQAIDEKTQTPPMQASVPPEQQDDANAGMLDNSLQGGSPLGGILDGMLGGQ